MPVVACGESIRTISGPSSRLAVNRMTTVVICTHNVLGASEWGGHMWVYLQYVESLRRLGCEVYWMEDFESEKDARKAPDAIGKLAAKLDGFGLSKNLVIFRRVPSPGNPHEIEFLNT